MTTTTTDPIAPAATFGHTTTLTPDGFLNWGSVGYFAQKARPAQNTPSWTIGLLQHVAAAVGDWPCLIELDHSSRHTVVGRIAAVQADYRQPQGWALVVEYDHGNGETHRTAHPGLTVGAITPLPAVGHGSAPSYYDVTKRLFAANGAAVDAWRRHIRAETGGYDWYGKITVHAGAEGSWHVYYDSQENERYDVTRPRKLSDGTERREYVYGPREAAFTVAADGTVTESYRHEHYDPAILAWRNG